MTGHEQARRRAIAFVLAAGAAVAVFTAGIILAAEKGEGTGGSNAGAAKPVAVETRTPAPELSGMNPITGQTVSLSDFRGMPVVVNVWASWCPGCNDEAPDLRRLAAEHPEAVVLGRDFQDTMAGAEEFYAKWEWRHPSIFDQAGSLTSKLGLLGLPTTFFLDAEHRIAARVVGTTDLDGFERGLELAKQPA